MSGSPRKVIFDTDPGIDDAMALLYLHACDNLGLLGITTIYGNASIENCTNNTLFLCEQFGVAAPVYRGANRSLTGEKPGNYPDFVHGKNGLADIDVKVSEKSVEDQDASSFLVESTKANPNEITIIAVARLTNIALAINKHPTFASRVKEIIFMGGAANCEGNVTTWAEANIVGDPEAASVVFNSGIPLVMVGLDVTLLTRMSHGFLDSLTSGMVQQKDLLLSINKVYASYYKTSQDSDEVPVHDSSAIAYAHNPNMFGTVHGRLSCILDGEQRGRTVFAPGPSGNHRVCLSVDSNAVLDDYLKNVTAAYR
ncbi:MAG: nucleoside hydrolase [bacterium]|jgi:inosine-uridine nucleoside N-ribohydrolase|nr:nucleoside hydrolase [Gammaproteobacteria bacterium]HIL84144.1 nucleoside hydrolase [Pseudomonadales bacterium]